MANRGSTAHITTPINAMLAAASWYMTRQPKASPTTPLTVRESRIPSNRPVITVPTVFPCLPSGARIAAAGTISCAMVAAMPISRLASSREWICPVRLQPSRNSARAALFIRISVLRSWRSPSGSRNRIPRAYPAWVSVGTMPIPSILRCRSAPISGSRG